MSSPELTHLPRGSRPHQGHGRVLPLSLSLFWGPGLLGGRGRASVCLGWGIEWVVIFLIVLESDISTGNWKRMGSPNSQGIMRSLSFPGEPPALIHIANISGPGGPISTVRTQQASVMGSDVLTPSLQGPPFPESL